MSGSGQVVKFGGVRFGAWWLAAGMGLLLAPGAALAEHFEITLQAWAPGGATAKAFVDDAPPDEGRNPRPVLKAHAGDTLTVQFIMTNVFPHRSIQGAGIRYSVARENEVGQKKLPDGGAGRVAEGTFSLDLKPQARIGARFRLAIDQPGAYLLRVESIRTQSNHEHFSAIDIDVE